MVELAEDAFDCAICMELANHDGGCPRSCSGCGTIYCETCSNTPTIRASCAVCRADGSKITPNFVVKKMCGMMKAAPVKTAEPTKDTQPSSKDVEDKA